MNKQELITSLNFARDSITTNEDDFRSGIRTGLALAIFEIEQLDEPEALSKEWIDKHITDGHNVNLGDKVVYADELDGVLVPKQELPVVPQVVADWYEQEGSRMMWWNWFYKWGGDQADSRTELEKRAIEWMQDFNEGLFVDIFRYGYEIEKEKLYYVIDKSRKPLLKAFKEEVSMSVCDVTVEEAEALEYPNFKYKLTEKQIKDYDERYWDFVQLVEEEEE